jgi:hypothetical protein
LVQGIETTCFQRQKDEMTTSQADINGKVALLGGSS